MRMAERLVPLRSAAKELGVGVAQLGRWRMALRLPPPVRRGNGYRGGVAFFLTPDSVARLRELRQHLGGGTSLREAVVKVGGRPMSPSGGPATFEEVRRPFRAIAARVAEKLGLSDVERVEADIRLLGRCGWKPTYASLKRAGQG